MTKTHIVILLILFFSISIYSQISIDTLITKSQIQKILSKKDTTKIDLSKFHYLKNDKFIYNFKTDEYLFKNHADSGRLKHSDWKDSLSSLFSFNTTGEKYINDYFKYRRLSKITSIGGAIFIETGLVILISTIFYQPWIGQDLNNLKFAAATGAIGLTSLVITIPIKIKKEDNIRNAVSYRNKYLLNMKSYK